VDRILSQFESHIFQTVMATTAVVETTEVLQNEFPRQHPDFYYKGWRGESAAESADSDSHFQQIAHAHQSGICMRTILQQLIESGGDERSVTDPKTGLTKYHTPTHPCQGIFRSSCTSNVATEEAFNRGLDTLRQLLLEAKNMSKQKKCTLARSSPEDLFRKLLCDVRERLRAIWELSMEDIVSLFPSGTDAELLPALLGSMRASAQKARGATTFSVITAAGEVGSGTANAAQGRHFAKRLPSGKASSHCDPSVFRGPNNGDDSAITGVSLYMRDQSGRLLSEEARDKLVEEAVREAAQEPGEDGLPKYGCVVVHMVVGSKTGQCMPSDACMSRLQRELGDLVLPVVDACQGRMGEGSIRRHLDHQRVVLSTGSKFYGGPPFSGVCLLSEKMGLELESYLEQQDCEQMVLRSSLCEYITAPLISDDLPKLRSLLPQGLNYGVLMRWTLALHGMEAYYAEVSEQDRVQLLSQWTQAMQQVILDKATPLIQLLFPDDGPETKATDEQSVALSTIVSFHCRCNRGTPETASSAMTTDELRLVQLLMASDLTKDYPQFGAAAKVKCFMGQPVDLSPDGPSTCPGGESRNVLRVAASAPMMVRAQREGLEALIVEDRVLMDKLSFILENWAILEKHSQRKL